MKKIKQNRFIKKAQIEIQNLLKDHRDSLSLSANVLEDLSERLNRVQDLSNEYEVKTELAKVVQLLLALMLSNDDKVKQ